MAGLNCERIRKDNLVLEDCLSIMIPGDMNAHNIGS